MEIKVNDYVRFKNGKIYKVNMVDERNNPLFDLNINGGLYSTHDVLRANSNIGKLLKVGDFIDGMRIIEIEDTTIHTLGGWFIDVEDVEDLVTSVVTKEMFEQMEYKID